MGFVKTGIGKIEKIGEVVEEPVEIVHLADTEESFVKLEKQIDWKNPSEEKADENSNR